jgi:hypothetical protein
MTGRSSHDAEQLDSEHGDIRVGPIGSGDTSQFKKLIVNNASPLNLRILSPNSETGLFYVANTVYTHKKPHITLYGGHDKSGPVLGVAYINSVGTNTVGIGDPESNLNSMVWERLSRVSKWTHETYQFEFIFGEEGRKSFTWQRLHKNLFDDQGDMVLFEDGKPDVILARYEGVGVFKWKKRGRMLILGGYGDGWESMVLLTGLALVELSRRRARPGALGVVPARSPIVLPP